MYELVVEKRNRIETIDYVMLILIKSRFLHLVQAIIIIDINKHIW